MSTPQTKKVFGTRPCTQLWKSETNQINKSLLEVNQYHGTKSMTKSHQVGSPVCLSKQLHLLEYQLLNGWFRNFRDCLYYFLHWNTSASRPDTCLTGCCEATGMFNLILIDSPCKGRFSPRVHKERNKIENIKKIKYLRN